MMCQLGGMGFKRGKVRASGQDGKPIFGKLWEGGEYRAILWVPRDVAHQDGHGWNQDRSTETGMVAQDGDVSAVCGRSRAAR